jgi:hypothetical protein
MAACVWGWFNGQPIIPYIISSFTQPDQDAIKTLIRFVSVILFIAAVIFFYYVNRLPTDIIAKRIADNAKYIKNAIIDMTQLYKSFVDEAIKYNTDDYFPLIKDDILVKKDIKAFRDKGIAIRSFLTYNPTNPLLEKLKETSQRWKDLDDGIERAVMDISDTKLNTYLHTYRNQMESAGTNKVKAKAVLNTNPITEYFHRQVADISQDISDSSAGMARTKLISYLDDLIIEYSEESKEEVQRDNVK